MMTSREAFVFGWVHGKITRESWKSNRLKEPNPTNLQKAAQYPLRSFAEIINQASHAGILEGDLNKDIQGAVWEIDIIDDDSLQPLVRQGSWQLGYYKALSGGPLPPPVDGLDIEGKRRKKNMSQEQLAKLVGVTQGQISRWEKGEAKPTEENMEKLKKVSVHLQKERQEVLS